MIKFLFILNILKRRVSNIVLLSIMFSSLLLIFMVGFSLKDIFYDYMRSGYGNIPDLKIKVDNINTTQKVDLEKKLHTLNKSMDMLFGYESIYPVTMVDNEDSVLTKDMPILIKGISFDPSFGILLNNKEYHLTIENLEYDDNLHIELSLKGQKLSSVQTLQFISKGTPLTLDFCTQHIIEDNLLIIDSIACKDDIDSFLQELEKNDKKSVSLELNSQKQTLLLVEVDTLDRTLILGTHEKIDTENIHIVYQNQEFTNDNFDSVELYDNELILSFKQSSNSELLYKRFLVKMLRSHINYKRFILDVKYYTFGDEDASESLSDLELTKLNKLTDFLDMIVHPENRTAIASSYLAGDLNNLGILNDFTINVNDISFQSSIRSTFSYNPEKLYSKNILIFNKKVLEEQFNIGDKTNFIDIYFDENSMPNINAIKKIFSDDNLNATFILQNDIIPSIEPKKDAFSIVLIGFSLFIFSILFVAMYIVLRQFYSNFEDELALLKLFGSTKMYQTYINTISLLISSFLIYFLLKIQEDAINTIMENYFFTHYSFDFNNYIISLIILAIYIVIINILEFRQMKKLNLIKGQ